MLSYKESIRGTKKSYRWSIIHISWLDTCSAVAEMGDDLATIDMDLKLGRGCAPLGGRGAGFPSNRM